MLSKDALKKISSCMAAVMIAGCSAAVFADNTNTTVPSGQTENTENSGSNTGGVTENPSGSDETPETTAINISANYFKTEAENTYNIIVSSLDYLEEYKDFSFTVSFGAGDANVKNYDFSDKLKTDNSSVAKTGKTITFSHGAPTEPQSGKLGLCSIELKSAAVPTKDNITISNFTAVDKDGKTITFTPNLTVAEGPVVPELSEKEQNVYDLMLALPDVAALSFYNEDKSLKDVAAVKSQVDAAADAYNALTDAEKKNVNAVLDYNMKDKEVITTLKPVTDAMVNVSEVISTAKLLGDAADDKLLNYSFVMNIYNSKIKDNQSPEGMSDTSAAYKEYTDALAKIAERETVLNEKIKAADYSDKVGAVSAQLNIIQTLSADKYYKDYLSDLLDNAQKLYKEIDASDDPIKEGLCSQLQSNIDKIKAVQSGINTMPTLDFPKEINRGFAFTIGFTRTRAASGSAAKITVEVYNVDEKPERLIESKDFDIAANETSTDLKMFASNSNYTKGDNIRVDVKYTIAGATFDIENREYTVETTARADTGNIGIKKGNSSSSSGDNSGSGGETKYPTVDDTKDNNDNKNDDTNDTPKELFGDISNYGWAKDAIEGLYYAGIVNGMEENVFNPAGEVTREQFCKMVVQLFGVLNYDETSARFNDVKDGAWYAPYIYSAVSAGYIQGQSDDFFGVGQPIMRQDMVTILYRALNKSNSAAALDFTDVDNIAEYAKDAVAQLVGMGVINGYEDGSFKPRGTATRAEAAKVIWGVYESIK